MKKIHKILCALILSNGVAIAEDATLLPADDSTEYDGPVEVAPQVALPLVLTLKDEVALESTRVYLGDISHCQGLPSICDEATGVDLGLGPRPGKSFTLTRDQIKRVTDQEFPNYMVTLNGSERVTLKTGFHEINSDMIKVELQGYLDSQLASNENLRGQVRVARLTTPLKVRPGSYKLHFPSLAMNGNLSLSMLHRKYLGHTLIDVWYVPDDPEVNKFSFKVQTKISIETYTPVATHALPKGQTVHVNDFEYQWLPLKRRHDEIISSAEKYEGWILKSTIGAGEPLLVSKIRKPRLVKRGDIVEMVLKRGSMVLSTKGKAMSDGAKDDSIKVYYKHNKKYLQAIVTGRSKVEVSL